MERGLILILNATPPPMARGYAPWFSSRVQSALHITAEDVQVCPEKCHVFTETGRVFHSEKCIHCMACTEACPVAALRPIGKWLSVEDCMAQIRGGRRFLWKKSGGGVTLSGGEVLMQKAFAQALLQRCHAEGNPHRHRVQSVWDTAVLEQLIPQLDLVMADIKSMDAPAHIRGTGCSNEKTLCNIRWLDSRNVPLIIRTPVIPGFNDSEDNIAQTAEFLKSLSNLFYYELLSYNPMGNDKRKRLGYPVPRSRRCPPPGCVSWRGQRRPREFRCG